MALPDIDTLVTYPAGDTSCEATVVHVEPLADDRSAVILDRTSFHPVDSAWPDQPTDRGALQVSAGSRTSAIPVFEAVTGGISGGALHLGTDLTVRTGSEGWVFVVAHIIDGAGPAVGDRIRVEVEADHRHALSVGHTACHLASLALDIALRDAWTKAPPLDSLGHPAFDAQAIQRSQIEPYGAIDVYRVGKSLRRKGFDPAALDAPDILTAEVNETLDRWVSHASPVRIERSDEQLSARRMWVCDLPDGRATIPCGGTHVRRLDDLTGVRVSLQVIEVDGGRELRMSTQVAPAAEPHHVS